MSVDAEWMSETHSDVDEADSSQSSRPAMSLPADWLEDPKFPRTRRILSFGDKSKGDTREIGQLGRLHPEILYMIIVQLDLTSLISLARTCHGAKVIAQTCPRLLELDLLYRLILDLRKLELLRTHSVQSLLSVLRQEDCVCCHIESRRRKVTVTPGASADCRIGTHVFLPTLERGCEACMKYCPRYTIMQRKDAVKYAWLIGRGQLRFRIPLSRQQGWAFELPSLATPSFMLYDTCYYSLKDVLETGVRNFGSLQALEAKVKSTISPVDELALTKKVEKEEALNFEEDIYETWIEIRCLLGGGDDDEADLLPCYAEPPSTTAKCQRFWDRDRHDRDLYEMEWLTNLLDRCEARQAPVPLLRAGRRKVEELYWCWACWCADNDNTINRMSGLDGGWVDSTSYRLPSGFADFDDFYDPEGRWKILMRLQAYRRDEFSHHIATCQAAPSFWQHKDRLDAWYAQGRRVYKWEDDEDLGNGLYYDDYTDSASTLYLEDCVQRMHIWDDDDVEYSFYLEDCAQKMLKDYEDDLERCWPRESEYSDIGSPLF